jgi:hypothetical protein
VEIIIHENTWFKKVSAKCVPKQFNMGQEGCHKVMYEAQLKHCLVKQSVSFEKIDL